MAQNSSASGWQGRTRDVPEVRHRWEQDWSEVQRREFISPPRKMRRKLLLLLAAAVAMGGTMVAFLSFRPQRVPLAAICLSDYPWPLAPNAGVGEDLAGLQQLDKANLNLVDLTEGWQNKQLGLKQLDEYLDRAAVGEPVLMLYISGHGIVNGEGEPCLVLPGYDPTQSERWLPLRGLISRIQARLDDTARAVLILDCVKSNSNWYVGKIGTTWTRQVRALMDELEDPRLAILSSTGPGQASHFSPQLNATPFGHFVKLGLAGLADYRFNEDSGMGGNGDGRVSLVELGNFVRDSVGGWVARHRGDIQIPELIPADARDCPLTWTLNANEISSIRKSGGIGFSPAVPVNEIAGLWRLWEEIKLANGLQFDPSAWRVREHELLHLERLAFGGDRYRQLAIARTEQLRGQLTRIRDRVAATPTSFVVRSQLLNEDPTAVLPEGSLGSIGMNEYFGVLDGAQAELLRDQFRSLAVRSDISPGAGVGESGSTRQLLESFLGLRLNGVQAAAIWPNDEPVSRMAGLHLLSESAGLPADVRVAAWTRHPVESADQVRRDAFDLLWTGDPTSFTSMLEKAEQAYRSNDSLGVEGETVANAFQLRDRVSSELPYLAQWLVRWQSPFAGTEEIKRQEILAEKRQLVSRLLTDVESLSRLLGETPAAGTSPAELLEATLAVQEKYRAVRAEFDAAWEEQATVGELRPEYLFELEAALSVPLLPWESRLELLKRWTGFESEMAKRRQQVAATNDAPLELAELANRAVSEAELQGNLANHPLLKLLGLEPPADDPRASDPTRGMEVKLERAGEAIRNRLIDCRREAFLDEMTTGLLGDRAADNAPGRRAFLAQRADWSRRVASLMSQPADVDSPRAWREFELQQLLIWQANRALADFFGFPPGSLGRELQREPTFALLVENWLDYATKRLPPTEPVQQQIAQTRLANSQEVAFANQTSPLSADTEIQLDATEMAALNVRLPVHSAGTRQSLPLQPGTMTLALTSDRDPAWGPRTTVPAPVTGDPVLRWEVPVEALDRFNRLTTLFRGHEQDAPVFLKGVSGYRLVIEPDRTQRSSITLFGARKGRSAILFILDCSQSMSNRIEAEVIGGEMIPRLTLAKGALATMLEELAARGDTRVGVSFFGHRIGWTTSEPTLPLRQDAYGGDIPDDLTPASDVELVLPVGRFSTEEVDFVVERMNTVRPWGQSPLYLALMQGLQDFEQEDPDVDRSIVLITDGLNYQFSPSETAAANAGRVTLDEVMRELGDKQIPVYVLGFGIADEERREATEQFFSIAEKSNGGYFEVESGKELLQTLRDQLNLGQYEVLDSSQRPVTEIAGQEFYRLNQPARLNDAGSFSVLFDTEQVDADIEGGEQLEFFVEDDGQIRSLPYDVRSPVEGPLASEGDPRVLTARVHRPAATAEGIEFPISFQFPNQAFTPRPTEVWIEITPVTDEAGGREPVTYTYYDRNYAAGTPVPVIRCLAPNWPADSNRAEVNVWCRFDRSNPTEEVPLAMWAAGEAAQAASRPVAGMDGIEYRVELVPALTETDSLLRIVETHSEISAGLNAVRTEVVGYGDRLPRRIVRQYDSKNGLAVHSYYFDRGDFSEILNSDDVRIQFTPRAEVLRGAWKLPQGPIGVPIVEDSGILPIEAATGAR